MRVFGRRILGLLFIAGLGLGATTPTITLYPPLDPSTKKSDDSKACFSFKRGLLKEGTKGDWDLGYGFIHYG